MAKILLGISLAIIIATAALGYMTREKVIALQGDLKETKSTLATTKTTLARTEADLKKTQDELTAAKATIEERDKEITKQKSDIEGLNTKLADATKQVEEKTAEVTRLNEDMSKLKEKLGSVNPEEMVAKMNQTQADLEKARTELAEAKQVQATLEQQKKEADEKLANTERTVQEYKLGISRAGLTGKVLAYNAGWNFVVLSIGDKAGIKANAQLIVTRNSQPIGKVVVTTVEPQTSIADIIPGSVAKGQSVQPGDTVIVEAKR